MRHLVDSSWNMMAQGEAREGKWRGKWRMEWVVSTLSVLHITSELGVYSITTADAHTSAVSSRLNWSPCRFKWTRPFRWKTKSVFCACAITFQTQYTCYSVWMTVWYAGCTLRTRQSTTQNNNYQVSHKHSCFSWWWAHSRPKHVEIDKYTKNKLCTKLVWLRVC
jgi:hypothetical protein